MNHLQFCGYFYVKITAELKVVQIWPGAGDLQIHNNVYIAPFARRTLRKYHFVQLHKIIQSFLFTLSKKNMTVINFVIQKLIDRIREGRKQQIPHTMFSFLWTY